MNIAIRHIGPAARRSIAILLLALCLGGIGALRASAQAPLEVRAIRGLDFGSMYRSSLSLVAYYNGNAALFEVKGKKGSVVQLMIGVTKLAQPAGPSGRSSMNVAIAPSRCAYSLDNGMSWTPFSAGAICQNVRIPSRGAGPGKVIVRIGGEVAARNDQHRGDYNGNITLTAVYE